MPTIAKKVPFFENRKARKATVSLSAPQPDYDVIIAGAGPVGMVLANLLGRDGHRVLVVEPNETRSDRSRAIGVTAPTLETLQRIGILESCMSEAVEIAEAGIYGDGGGLLGGLSFHRLSGSLASVVSLPQRRLEALLEEAMTALDSVTFLTGRRLSSHRDDHGVMNATIDGGPEGKQAVSARWLVACDGSRSRIRERLRMPVRRRQYACRFAMADFEDCSGFGESVRLFFTADGAVESFPLPGGRRRWVVQTGPTAGSSATEDAPLLAAIERRATWAPQAQDRRTPWSSFVPRHLLCERFFHGRTLLCGDAAHVMSPIGGHGMNVGVGDALAAYSCLGKLLNSGEEKDALQLLRNYDRCRREAFVRASSRAALGMWAGTRSGKFASAVRAFVLTRFLISAPVTRRLAGHFSMRADLSRQLVAAPPIAVNPALSADRESSYVSSPLQQC